MSIRVLGIHTSYACRHSGACCSAGWRIPVDDGERRALEIAAGTGSLPRQATLTESRNGLTVLRLAADGTCTAFERASGDRLAMCAIHRVLGPEALPIACRHFPRVCLLDPRGVSVTLSHFCPTAADLLFADGPIAVAEDPLGYDAAFPYEGLDARDSLPPLLAPGMLMDLESYVAWEARALGVLADDQHTPESALAVLRREVDCLRTWSPRRGPLLSALSALAVGTVPTPTGSDPSGSDPVGSDPIEWRTRRFLAVLECVHDGLTHPGMPEEIGALDERCVARQWTDYARPLRRYLAARLHASWVAYQGRGLRTVLESLAAALAVVRVEAARACAQEQRSLDRPLLLKAIRMADLLLVHKADPLSLARRWSDVE